MGSIRRLSVKPSPAKDCLQQVTCADGKTTTITGKVFAPNGIDPTRAFGNVDVGALLSKTITVNITTTSQYTIVGYTGGFSSGMFALLELGSGWLLWMKRRAAGSLLRCALALCLMAAASVFLSGCSGKVPAKNAAYTAPGDYTYTLTATDGFLTHSATYTLHVTVD